MNQALGNSEHENKREIIPESDAKLLRKVKRIIDRGNNAEVKKKKDGSVAVYEVKKSIV